MPIYEYQCQQCGHQLEALQKISDDPLKDCPECAEAALQKLVSAASFRLKGGGWYETDFKSGDKKHLAESDSGKEKSKDKDKVDTKSSDNKSASKAESGDKAKPAAGKGAEKPTNSNSSTKKADK